MKMLINATRAEQLRVAVVEGTTLQEYQVQIDESGLTRGNIYRGVVANVQPSLNAAFIDIGEERHGFLPVGDVLESAYQRTPPKNTKRPSIDQVLQKGQPILVQVTKDSVGQKGAALTTNIALAGRYLVLTPFDSVRGISRKAEDDQDRKTIKSRLKKLSLPDDCGVIVRTNGIDQNQATLNRDLNALLRLWRKVQTESGRGKGSRLLYSDQDLVVQALRDYLDPEIEQVIVDNDEVHEKAEDYMKAFMPRSKTKLVRYKDGLPLFSRYRLETQIDKIYERTAALPSGGSIVIDLTEALTAIDVNSGRATRNSNHEDSIFKINCEAAKEVARQLRLRDIGGLVVVDFIDMRLRKHQARLEKVLRDAMKPDKARYSVGRVSPNGLVEINRQRIKQSLRLRTHRPCPTCNGQASIPTPDFAALRLLSRVEGRAASGRIKHVTIALHPEFADMLQNHYRRELMGLEQDLGIEVEVIASSSLRRTEEKLDWVERSDEEAKAREKKQEAAFSSTDLTAESRKRSRKSRKKDDGDRDSQKSQKQQSKGRSGDDKSDQDEDKKSSSSRRRRSRRKKDDDQPSKIQAKSQDEQKSKSKDDDDDSKSGSSRSRRRRRGGRGRKRSVADDKADQGSQKQSAQGGQKDDDQDDASKTQSKRRRSRSRSRRRDSDDGQQESRADSKQPSKPDSKSDSKSMSQGGDSDSQDDGKKTVRRRRRSRSRSADDGSDSASRSDGQKSQSQASKSKESKAKASQPKESRAKPSQPKASKAKDDGGDADAPKRSRSRSRRSGRGDSADKGSGKGSGKSDDKSQGAKSSASSKASKPKQDDSGNDGSDGNDGPTKTRRRRSRSRSRSRGDDGDSGGDQSSGNGSGSRSRKTSGSGGSGGGDVQPAMKAESRETAAPVGVLAGQGLPQQDEKAPTKKRRWAWWGGPSNPAPDPNESN